MPSISDQQRLGWGNPDSSSFRTSHIVALKTAGVTVYVNKELVAIFKHLIDTLDAWGEDINKRADDWGYANRDIRGVPGSKSYHAWGLAVDINATENVLGVRKTTFPVDRTRALAKSLGLRWGYDYSGRPDPMHFEFIGSLAEAREITHRLTKKPAPVKASFPLPAGHVFGRQVSATVHNGKKNAKDAAGVVRIQKRLKVKQTGFYGPLTAGAVRAWQIGHRMKATGRVGAPTWKALGL